MSGKEPRSLRDPTEYPEAKLLLHSLEKGFQGGSALGLLGIAPFFAYQRQVVDVETALKGAAYGAISGTALSGVLYLAKRMSMDQDGVKDRVFKLHYNESQHRTDTFAHVGAALGAAAAAFFLNERVPLTILGGAAAGSLTGIVAHLLTRPLEQRSTSRALHELRH